VNTAPESIRLDTLSAEVQMAASRWVIDRHIAENWSMEDQARLDDWLSASVANKIAYLRADHAWSRTARAAALRRPTPGRSPSGSEGGSQFKRMRLFATLGAIALLGAVAVQYFRSPSYSAYTTSIGGRQVLSLSDGSQIELNTDSAVRVVDRNGTREVIVDKGEVYFDVKHDPVHPFSVLAGDRRINDLGTKFLVREQADRLEIALLEGRVRVDAPNGSGKRATNMGPGDVAVATSESTTISKHLPAVLSNQLSWRQGVLVFHHTALAEAAAEFNRYNSHKVVIADPSVGKLEINGKFRTNDVEMFTDTTADILGLHVEKLDDKTLMAR
jgi:transmembrane sensor